MSLLSRFKLGSTPSWLRLVSLVGLVVVIVGLFFGNGLAHLGWSLTHWQARIWAMDYWASSELDPPVPDEQKHLIFVMVDHYEPGKGEKAARLNKEWCDKFRNISNANKDDYGNRFRYTWFYPFDHHNEAVMTELAKMAYEGYGEVEMHWHLSADEVPSAEDFGASLKEAIRWYQQFGAMITAEQPPRTAFAYIAGNWDLDAGRSNGSVPRITNQLQELFDHGCYADFTFSTIGVDSQPAKVNSIYYAQDDPKLPKSYNDGIDAKVGSPVDDKLMIFEGPLSLEWNGALEYGAMEKGVPFHPHRIDKWIDANIHVSGRPEWVFAKVYSHGAQSADTVLDRDMELMLKSLSEQCRRRGIKLHYMSSREAYNVVKAAESGEAGNPEDYRDFRIPKYRNMVVEPTSVLPEATEPVPADSLSRTSHS